MRPFFTTRVEWQQQLRPAGRRAYLRAAVGHTVKAGALGVLVLIIFCGAVDPYWRSLPVLMICAASLLFGAAGAFLLFSREWNAAERTYRGC